MKYALVFCIAVAASIAIAVLIIKGINRRHPLRTWVRRILYVVVTIGILLIMAGIYLADYYHADPAAQEYLHSSDTVTVSRTDNGWYFDGPGTDSGIIFYPGAKVEETAYAPLLYRLAENGQDCFLVSMPFRIAFLDINAADQIIQTYDHSTWYMMGHSLGGVAAASYASGHEGEPGDHKGISGIIFLASYPTQKLNIPALFIYGSNDGVVNLEALNNSIGLCAAGEQKVIIDGGNHAGFGDYGAQKGDGEAAITSEEQQERTVDAVLSWTQDQNPDDSEDSGTETKVDGDSDSMSSWKDPIPDLPDDFILGMDASTVLAEENSGVKYYNFDGQEQDIFKTYADSGINYIRLRVWNDPYDAEGHGYGGGNNDLETAVVLGKRASDNGMKVCIDFHYSDFWADPSRQLCPKAWEGMAVDEKADALYDFTKESLTQLLDAGVDVGMVQIGNEINYGMSGETRFEDVLELLKSGSKAVRDISNDRGKDIRIVVHYTDVTRKAEVLSLVSKLVDGGLDFDMIGLSYYAFWNGSMDNMQRVIQLIQERYNKRAFIAETSYAYTSADGDGTGNSFSSSDIVKGYPIAPSGQAQILHDIACKVNEVGGAGIMYWEGAWIPVGPGYEHNLPIWEKYGSGWASSYAASYDEKAKDYGGSAWDNQALFDFHGKPLDSLNVFRYMREGAE